MTPQEIRLLLGLPEATVGDDVLAAAMRLAQIWCDSTAAKYRVTAPETAVADMTLFYLRNHLDTAGIKPSSLSLPDISMATDFKSACELLLKDATDQIRNAAIARGNVGFNHIRSGKVQRWRP